MNLTPGSTLGPYKIVAAIGAGGMGVVYRATDTRLGRDVAIKVLPDEVAADPDRLARFEREARALAALNHFNIAQVYGFEGRALVMELLEGETLRERLQGGPLPIRKAIDYATQIARGLAAAHERGIIHRDLKPENVFVVSDGHIKILDFGLARRDSDALDLETKTGHVSTAPGMVLGTVGYMSPEQVRGQQIDARSDLFSLGTVLYEMLTGARAFRRESSADTMAAILNDQPRDLMAVRPDMNAALDRIVQHCLEKNPVERFHSARDVAFALESLSGSTTSVSGVVEAAIGWSRERIAWATVTTILMVALAWLWIGRRTPPAAPLAVSRTLLVLPQGVAINETSAPGSRIAVSPDGSRIVLHGRHASSRQSQFFVLPLDGGAATPLAATEGAGGPVWAPDSRQMLFSSGGTVMRLSLDGGGPVRVADNVNVGFTAAAWGAQDVAVFGGLALRRVNMRDGTMTVLRENSNDHYFFPSFLPDGRRFVFGTQNGSGDMTLVVGRIDSPDVDVLLSARDLGKAVYANGALLYTRGATLFAQRLEDNPPRLAGNAVVIADAVETSTTRGGAFAVSANGVVVYQAAARESNRLTWLDRKGNAIATVGDDADYTNVELSGDARRALVSITDPRLQTRDIFTIDLGRGVRQRFTIDPSDERSAVWSADSRRVIYTSKGLDLYSRAADSSGDEQRVIVDQSSKDPYDTSADGRFMLYRRTGATTGNDVWIGPLDGSGPGRAIAATRFSEIPGAFSPDGRFVVYFSDESGQPEVYVVNIDGGGKEQISTGGGVFPVWRGDGREIIYVSIDGTLMSAAVTPEVDAKISTPRALFKTNIPVTGGRMFDITPDGTRVLAALPVPSRIPQALTVVTNWPRLLEQD
jgi:Tol biopolymer transport system component/predicted Ser/Thr protein kinase